MKFLAPEQTEKPRKCRLCKKLHLDEFQELGFSFELIYDRSALPHDDVLGHLTDFVEAQGRVLGGGGSPEQAEISDYLCLVRVGSLDEADREGARPWLEA